jgi:hypothetical protein
MSTPTRTIVAAAVLTAALAVASPVRAQEPEDDPHAQYGGVQDRFRISAGAFFVSHDTFALLRPRDTDIPGIDLEIDTRIPEYTTDFRVEGHWRFARRHRLLLGYWSLNRGATTTLAGEIEWDGEVFPVNARVATIWDTRIFSIGYRYSLVNRERFNLGLGVGFFSTRVRTGISLGTDVSEDAIDESHNAPLPMGAIDFEWWPARRVKVGARAQYLAISIKETVDGDWGDFQGYVEWLPFERFGFGAGYNYTKIDVAALVAEKTKELEYKYEFHGPSVYAVVSW